MLKLQTPVACFPWWRRIILPFYHVDQMKIIVPPVAICAILAIVIGDWYVLVPSLIVVYFGFVLTMQKLNPYMLFVEPQRADEVVHILDETPFLTRQGSKLRWERIHPFRWMRSELDTVEVEYVGKLVAVKGRKQDMIALSVAMRSIY